MAYSIQIVLITFIILITLAGGLIIFFRAIKQQRTLHETIMRSQNEKEIETYSHIAGEYLHQQVINGRILPHLIRLKELNQLVGTLKTTKGQDISDKIQDLMRELKHTESIVRNISENIFPPHLTYFFTETCQKRLDELQQLYPNKAQIVFNTEGVFNNLSQSPTLLYNLYSLIDLFATNSLQYAQANEIKIILKRQQNQITLAMHDDGIGFKIHTIEHNAKGRGLADFKARYDLIPSVFFQ
jgi:signal transduction histidine kinase